MNSKFQDDYQLYNLFALMIFILGTVLRLLNLTNPPLDFHPWLQLRSATIARGLYYEMLPSSFQAEHQTEISMIDEFDVLEPRLFERLVAVTYWITGEENLWVARLYAISFWGIGGIALFLLARRIFSNRGALVSLAYYMLLPYCVSASRSFQPDPLMVMWVMLAAYTLYLWSENKSWNWAISAGIFSGMAVLTEVIAVYCIALMAILLVLFDFSFREALKNRQIWVMASTMVLIPAIYYFGLVGSRAPGSVTSWVLDFQGLVLKPFFYVRWLNMLHDLIDLTGVFLGAACVMVFPRRSRHLMVGLWLGYGLLGLSVPSLIITNDYYNLLLIPIVALSLAWLGEQIIDHVAGLTLIWRVFCVLIGFLALAYPAWTIRTDLLRMDFRDEVKGWQQMGEDLPQDADIIALTDDYGTRLMYYGKTPLAIWPYAEDQNMNVLAAGIMNMSGPAWIEEFTRRTEGFDYFLVTNMGELEKQPELKEYLFSQYSYREGDGYLLFDLRNNP